MKTPKQRQILGLQRVSALMWEMLSGGLYEDEDGGHDEQAVNEIKSALMWIDDVIEETALKAARRRRRR